MSRRDEALTAVDSLLTSVRSQITAAINDARTDQPRAPSLADRLRAAVQPPPDSSADNRTASTSTERNPAQYWADAVRGRGNLTSDQVYESAAVGGDADGRVGVNRPQDDDDDLPGYSRRPLPAEDPSLTASLPPRRPRRLQSKTGKLLLDLNERSGGPSSRSGGTHSNSTSDRIIIIQEQPDGPTSISGVLTLQLKDPEPITHVRIRLKGIVRTLVFKAHASGRHPVSDEVCFLEDSHPLWYRVDAQDGSVRLPPEGNMTNQAEYNATGKLVGAMKFGFRVTIPARLTHLPETGQLLGTSTGTARGIRPPPSFMLDGDTTSSSPSSSSSSASPAAAALGGFEGSCRYYLKVTLGRQGLLKLNERWIVPVVFVPRQFRPVSPSPARELELARLPAASSSSTTTTSTTLNPALSSKQDPQGWTDPGKYVSRTALKSSRAVFKSSSGGGGAQGWVRLEGRVPKPQRFVKGQGELLEFEVQITCSDAASLARFTPATIAVSLLQRTVVSAQGISNTYDRIVLHANKVVPLGGSEGYTVRGGGGGGGKEGVVAYEIVYSGAIKLIPGLTSSFRAPNLQVAYLLCITFYQPTVPKSSGVVITPSTHLSSLAIPLEIVSAPPRPPNLVEAAPRPRAQTQSVSYSGGGGGPPPPPMYPPPSGPAPPATPRRSTMPSQSTPSASNTAAAATAPAPTSSSATPTTAAALDQVQVEESRLEEMYGLPPSYFDVVEEENHHAHHGLFGGRRRGSG
ncbi:hypothetical protein JCM10908_007157 [Rhodotorula pacifica]|uniref:uncharacterized protein n=1 Tax=Rhodotorula pacifica TaxID=1495444 RepID=UPI00316DDAFD